MTRAPNWSGCSACCAGAGAELHYIYIPCSPIHGNNVSTGHRFPKVWTSADYLRAHLSDRVIPRICTATPIGKMDWHTSGWAVEPVAENENFMWIRTPYTPEYFKRFAPIANDLENIRVNPEGTIDIQYMAQIGDDIALFGVAAEEALSRNDVTTQPESSAKRFCRWCVAGEKIGTVDCRYRI